MTRFGAATAAVALLAMSAGWARATDQPVPGRKLLLSDRAGRQRATFDARGPGIAAPSLQGSDDPTRFGATLRIVNPVSGESASFDLPASHWSVSASGTAYRFKNRVAPAPPSEVRIALLRSGGIKVSARASGISLDEPSQGTVAVVLTTGTHRYCASFGGRVTRDVPGRFKAMSAPAPASCPGGSTTSTAASTSTTTTSTSTTSTTTTLPGVAGLQGLVGPNGDADGDGFSNSLELAECSNPADAASTPENDHSLCANATIFSDTLGPSWGNTNKLAEPSYNAAVTALVVQNASDCAAYCQTTTNIGSPEACNGNWPWSGVPEHGSYGDGETVEVNFPDEEGNGLAGTIFLPPGVTCMPHGQPVCDGMTDQVTCTAPGGQTYPAVVICDGFTGTQRMYFWAAHRLAQQGYITMTFDVSGQGRSQGAFPNPDTTIAADAAGSAGFSRDTGTAVNYLVSAANPVRDLIAVSPLLIVNQATGASDHTEPYVLGVAGHSAGATGAVAYQQSTETTLYPVRARAVVGWSAFDGDGTIGNVPIQVHSGDEDSGFIEPPGSGTVAPDNERRYDRLGGDRNLDSTPDFTPHDRQVVIIEGGTHLNYSQVPWAYYPTWAEEVEYHYTLAWFDRYLKGDVGRTMSGVVGGVIQSVDPFTDYAECTMGADCFTATQRLKLSHAHLSDTFCSRYDVGGDTSGSMKGPGCTTQ